jgi:hypothetical protein
MALPAAEIINETMWVVYYAISKKSSKFIVNGIEVNESFWVNTFSSKEKLSGALKALGILSDLSNMSYEIKNIDSKMTEKDATSYFVKNKWHEALKSQVSKFISNPKFSFISKLSITRQSDFYDDSGLNDFLKKVWSIFKFTGTFDRWNPADVWFYGPNSIKEIKDYLKVCSVYKPETKSLPPRVQKNLALEDILGLNKLFVKLFDEKKLAPISLKKSTLYKAEYSFRIGLVNVPQNDLGRPAPPKVTKKQIPIKTSGSSAIVGGAAGSSGVNLKYDIEIDQVEYDMKGTKKYVREYDYIGYNEKGKTLGVKKERQFESAQGGSLGMDLAEKVLYTASGSRAIKQIRDNVFNQSLSPDVLSKGRMIGKDYQDKLSNAFEYISEMAKNLDPSIKNAKIKFAVAESNNKSFVKDKNILEEIQNKLEIAIAIDKSNMSDELILDLWSAITSKGITNRKDYERLVERIGKGKLEKSKKKGQTRLTQSEADEQAKQSLSATIVGDKTKIPGSFHVKLY